MPKLSKWIPLALLLIAIGGAGLLVWLLPEGTPPNSKSTPDARAFPEGSHDNNNAEQHPSSEPKAPEADFPEADFKEERIPQLPPLDQDQEYPTPFAPPETN